MAIPTLDPIWRPNGDDATVDDRELIRGYANWPLAQATMQDLTVTMNRVAEFTSGVAQVQAWIDEIESLTLDYAGKVADGTASIEQAREYEGPMPGVTLTRDDIKSKVDVLEWDTSLRKVRYTSGGASTSGTALSGARVSDLKAKVLMAVGIKANGGGGGAQLVRS